MRVPLSASRAPGAYAGKAHPEGSGGRPSCHHPVARLRGSYTCSLLSSVTSYCLPAGGAGMCRRFLFGRTKVRLSVALAAWRKRSQQPRRRRPRRASSTRSEATINGPLRKSSWSRPPVRFTHLTLPDFGVASNLGFPPNTPAATPFITFVWGRLTKRPPPLVRDTHPHVR
jgi:hypothetical protein